MTTICRVQQTELKILDEVVRLCDEHGLTYFLLEGTLLGAIRHHGFIPWDDDIDIGMPREDYEKFLALCDTDLGERFALQWFENEKTYRIPFAKIRLKNTLYIDHSSAERFSEQGFWIDIFPIDQSKSADKLSVKLKDLYLKKLVSLSVIFNKGGENPLQRMLAGAMKLLHIDTQKLMRKHNAMARKGQGDFLVNHGSAYGYKKQTVPTDLYFPPRKAEFEGKMYSIPNKAEELLARIYGDYMQIPPEEQRVARHNALKIQFEDGTTE